MTEKQRHQQERQGFFTYAKSDYFFDKFVWRWRHLNEKVRTKIFTPIAKFLHENLHLTPNMLTGIGALVGIAAPIVYLSTERVWVTSILLIFWLCLDGLDGTLARMYGLKTEKGSAFDITADITTSAIVLIGLSFAMGKEVLGLFGACLFLFQEWFYIMMSVAIKKTHTPFHGHPVANIAFVLSLYTLGIWVHVIFNTIGIFLGVYVFFIAKVSKKSLGRSPRLSRPHDNVIGGAK